MQRLRRRQDMVDAAQHAALRVLASELAGARDPRSGAGVAVAARVGVPLWDTAWLEADAAALLAAFVPAAQGGPLHGGRWQTLSLRSRLGTLGDDRPGLAYSSTVAWAASTYIVPWVHYLIMRLCLEVQVRSSNVLYSPHDCRHVLAELASPFERVGLVLDRVRLSILPPGTNVGWHVDYEGTESAGPMRMHIPILCSDQFVMEIGDRRVEMAAGETWLGLHACITPSSLQTPPPPDGQHAGVLPLLRLFSSLQQQLFVPPPAGMFELPHRLANQNGGTPRVHLIVDVWPRQPTRDGDGGGVPKVDWLLFCSSAFGEALAAAHRELFAHPHQPKYLQDCLAAFSKYRWSGGATTFTPEDVAAVEARMYLRQGDDLRTEGCTSVEWSATSLQQAGHLQQQGMQLRGLLQSKGVAGQGGQDTAWNLIEVGIKANIAINSLSDDVLPGPVGIVEMEQAAMQSLFGSTDEDFDDVVWDGSQWVSQ